MSGLWLKQSTSVTVQIGPFLDKTDGVSLEVGLGAALDSATTGIRLTKNGATQVDRNDATVPAYTAMGLYAVVLDATDTDTLGTLRIIFEEAATCLPVWQDFMIVPANVYNSFVLGTDVLDVSLTEVNGAAQTATLDTIKAETVLIVADTNELQTDWTNAGRLDLILDIIAADTTTDIPALIATAQADLDIITGASGVNLLTATQASIDAIEVDTSTTLQAELDAIQAAVITNAAGADIAADIIAMKVDTAAILVDTGTTLDGRIPAALVGGLMSSDVTAISTSTAAADNLEASAETIIIGAAEAGTLSTTVMTSDLAEATDDHYNGRIVIWTSGVLLGQATDITDYLGSTGQLTFTAVTEAPSAADTFVIV